MIAMAETHDYSNQLIMLDEKGGEIGKLHS